MNVRSRELSVGALLLVVCLVLPATAEDHQCYCSEECIHQDSCTDFKEESAKFYKLDKTSPPYNSALDHLKGRVCDQDAKHVCCTRERNPRMGRLCFTAGGSSGTCQQQSRCQQSSARDSCGWGLVCCVEEKECKKGTRGSSDGSEDVGVRCAGVRCGRPSWSRKPSSGSLCGIERSDLKVFNGAVAKEGQFPFMASLVWTSPRPTGPVTPFCGGVLITRR